MSFDECTDSILRETDFAQEHVVHSASSSSASTEELLNEDYIGTSTGSLINKDVRELLDEVFIRVSQTQVENDNKSPEFEQYSDEAEDRSLMTIWAPQNNRSQGFQVDDRSSIMAAENMKDNCISTTGLRKETNELLRDPIPFILFNKIQVFLLRNGMSLEFLKIFKRYVEHLIESGVDPLQDQYLLALQNELSEGFTFTPLMEDILNKFLLRPENPIMKLSLFEYNSARNLLGRYMRAWKLHEELKRSLTKLAGLWYDYLQRKFFIKWNQKYVEFTFHWDQQAQDFNNFTLASFGFDKWFDKKDSNEARKGLADHYFLNHIFQKIKRKKNAFNLSEHRSQEFYNAIVKKWALSFWRLKYRETRFEMTNLCLQRKMLGKFRWKLRIYKSLSDRSRVFNYTWQVSVFFTKWNESKKSMNNQSAHLLKLEQKFIKYKTMKIFEDQLQRRRREHTVSDRLEILLMQFFLKKVWFKRFEEQLHLYSIWSIQSERIMGKFLAHWKKRLYIDLKAIEVARTHALGRYLKNWRYELKCKLFITKRLKTRQKVIFNLWEEMTVLRRRVRGFEMKVLAKPTFLQWVNRSNENQRLERIAVMNHEEVLKIQSMICWHHKLVFFRALNQRAEILQRLRAILMVKKVLAHIQEINRLGESLSQVLDSKVFLPRYFNIWKREYSFRNRLRLQNLSATWELEKQLLIKSKFFSLWKKRIQFYHDFCLSKSNDVYQRSLQMAAINILQQRFHGYLALIDISDDFHNGSVLSFAFYGWISRLKRLKEMNVLLEGKRNKKDLTLLLNYLNVWSMGILKSRRNYEAVQVFRSRWDRATVRGLLLVWKTRMETPQRGHEEIVLRQDIELKTPIRGISPKGSGTIPGSERVKMHRIEAMKSHYRRVRRVIPSPLKSSLTLNSTAKKKIENEEDSVPFGLQQEFPKMRWQKVNQNLPPPPRLSLEKINKNLASKIDRINFQRIPEVRLEPFINSNSQFSPIDRSLLKVEEDETAFDESPTRRS